MLESATINLSFGFNVVVVEVGEEDVVLIRFDDVEVVDVNLEDVEVIVEVRVVFGLT